MVKIIYPTAKQWEVLEELNLVGYNAFFGHLVIVSPAAAEQLQQETGVDPHTHNFTFYDGAGDWHVSYDAVTHDDNDRSAFEAIAHELRNPEKVLERQQLLRDHRSSQAKLTFYED